MDFTHNRLHSFLFALLVFVGVEMTLFLGKAMATSAKSTVPIEGVERWILKNGLRILFHPSSRIPKVYYHTLFAVGSADEKEGETGLAHTLEHLLFKGDRNQSGSAFKQAVEKRGISIKATTSYDYSLYDYDLPSQHLKWLIQMEANRISRPLLYKKDLKTEKPVILEKRSFQLHCDPWEKLYLKSMELLFGKHPYGQPIIGHVKDIKNSTKKQVSHFYTKYYVPQNAILVIAGDFDPAKAKKWIQKSYGKIPQKPLEKLPLPKGPPQKQFRKQTFHQEVKTTYLSISFQGAPKGTPDSYALDVLSFILGGNTTSRLYRRSVYFNRVSPNIYSLNNSYHQGGAFLIQSQIYPNVKPERALYLIKDELRKLRMSAVSPREIQKVKAHFTKTQVERLATLKGRSHLLAYYELFLGGYQKSFHFLEHYKTVTPQKILQIANKYLKPTQMNITLLSPLQDQK